MDSKGATKFGLHPTPEGPFREGNDLSAVRCKSILRSKVAQPVWFFPYMPQSDQGTLRQSWLSFYKTARYHIFRTAVHQDQFYCSRSLTSLGTIFVMSVLFFMQMQLFRPTRRTCQPRRFNGPTVSLELI